MDTENIGRFLLKLRKENSLTQRDIAKMCNVSAQAVSKWERGDSIPDIELLERLSILYKVSINELITGEKQEVYVDLDKRRKIINLTAAVLVFMAYLFNFVRENDTVYHSNWGIYTVMKGYELIFNGVGGLIVFLAWIVFMTLISHLIIRIYLVTKIIDNSENINKYLLFSMIGIIIISIINITIPGYYVFPQLIIITAVGIQLSTSFNTEKTESIKTIRLKEYKSSYKNESIDQNLLLNEEDNSKKKLVRISKSLVRIVIVLYFLLAVFFITVFVGISMDEYGNDQDILIVLLISIAIISLATYTLLMYKYIGSFNTKRVLLYLGITTSVYSIFIIFFLGVTISGGITGIIFSILYLFIITTAAFLFYTSSKLKKQV